MARRRRYPLVPASEFAYRPHGCDPGAASLAVRWALLAGVPTKGFDADFQSHGAATARLRNARFCSWKASRIWSSRSLWQEAGRPKGRKDEYLERACELQAFVEHPAAALMPNPMVAHPQPACRGS